MKYGIAGLAINQLKNILQIQPTFGNFLTINLWCCCYVIFHYLLLMMKLFSKIIMSRLLHLLCHTSIFLGKKSIDYIGPHSLDLFLLAGLFISPILDCVVRTFPTYYYLVRSIILVRFCPPSQIPNNIIKYYTRIATLPAAIQFQNPPYVCITHKRKRIGIEYVLSFTIL